MSGLILFHLTIILTAGFIAGWVCKRLNVSLLIGYMLIGALIGPGGLNISGMKFHTQSAPQTADDTALQTETASPASLAQEIETQSDKIIPPTPVSDKADQLRLKSEKDLAENVDKVVLEGIAQFGVLLLLFAIGIEFSLDNLSAMSKFMFVGGTLQMLLTGVPAAILCHFLGLSWAASALIGCVFSLSSTALVYKSMQDEGVASTHRCKASLGVLLFQDVALVPMLLLVPILSGGAAPDFNYWLELGMKSLVFCAIIIFGKILLRTRLMPQLAKMRARELLILFVLTLLMGLCTLAIFLGLTPALGALAAGLMLGETRLTAQIEALFIPFRESFSAMFFISLGMLTDFGFVVQQPGLCIAALVCVVLLKTFAGAAALILCGFGKWSGVGFGLGMAQVGELAFMLLTTAFNQGMVPENAYHAVLFVSVASLVLTPHLVKLGMRIASAEKELPREVNAKRSPLQQAMGEGTLDHVIVIGAGHIGTHLAARLETMGKNVSVIDFSPINLYKFAQEGLSAIAGDATKTDVLQRAGIEQASAIFVTVPDDMIALSIVRACRDMNPSCSILCRVRYNLNIKPLQRAGAELVVCEETNVCNSLLKLVSGYD